MNYNEFLTQVSEDIRMRFPDTVVRIQDVAKLQEGSYKGISVGPKFSNVSAVFNMEGPFREMMSGRPYGDILQGFSREVAEHLGNMPVFSPDLIDNYATLKQDISLEVVSKEGNAEMLKTVPYRDMLDMAVVCRFNIGGSEDGRGMSVLATHDVLRGMNVTPTELFKDAMQVAPEAHPLEIVPLYGVLQQLSGPDEFIPEEPEDAVPIYVCSTPDRSQGAGVIAYPEFMERASEAVKGDFFLLPSSIHEVLILPDNGIFNYRELQQMVTEVNATQVLPQEKLTDNVYHYDAEDRVFETGEQFAKRSLEKAFSNEHRSVLAELKANQKACEAQPHPQKSQKQKADPVL